MKQMTMLDSQQDKASMSSEDDKEMMIRTHLKYLETNPCIWDMRCWNLYHDITEVKEYVKHPTNKNDGHAMHCIEQLKAFGIKRKIIRMAIMNNNTIMYKDRLVPCMIEGMIKKCPVFKIYKNYSHCTCESQPGDKERMKEKQIKNQAIGTAGENLEVGDMITCDFKTGRWIKAKGGK